MRQDIKIREIPSSLSNQIYKVECNLETAVALIEFLCQELQLIQLAGKTIS